jgi:hypothetical protein
MKERKRFLYEVRFQFPKGRKVVEVLAGNPAGAIISGVLSAFSAYAPGREIGEFTVSVKLKGGR